MDEIAASECPNEKASILKTRVDDIMDKSYPLKRSKFRDTDDPWIDDDTRRNIRKGRKFSLGKEDQPLGKRPKTDPTL